MDKLIAKDETLKQAKAERRREQQRLNARRYRKEKSSRLM